MQTETNTPIEERYLRLAGRVSPKSTELLKPGLPSACPPNTEVFFVGFAYADLPFSKRFDVVFPRNRPQDGVRCRCKVEAATQQYSKPLPQIPHGWKTICVVHFPDGIPQLVRQLPLVDGWHQNEEWICICDEETWQHLKKAH